MKPGIGNLKGIAEMVLPTTVTGIQQFLGATGFYRRFIRAYTKIAQPLNDLISDENSKLKNQTIEIMVPALKAFHELKLKCMQAPVLAFIDFHKPFLLETDASSDSLGVVLSQKQEDRKYHPVAYASHCLSQVTESLDADSVWELIQHTKAHGTLTRADMDDPRLVQEDAKIDDKIIVQARVLMSRKAVLHNVVNKHWVSAQATDPVIRLVWNGWLGPGRIR